MATNGTLGLNNVGASIDVTTSGDICPNPDDPLVVPDARGAGGDSECPWRPLGDPRVVQAVIDQAKASQTPTPEDTSYIAGEYDGPGPSLVVRESWYRIDGDVVQIKYRSRCGTPPSEEWFSVRPDDAGSFVPQVSAADLAASLRVQVIRQLPAPIPRIGPADEDPQGWTFVNIRTSFWVDQAPGQWAVVTGSTSAGAVSVTVRAEPARLVVDPGDGADAVVCEGAPPAVTGATYTQTIDRACAYTYRDSSAMAPNGESFPVTVSIVWHASWTASTGEGGDLGYVSTSAVRDLQVAERQAVIVDTDG